MTLVWEVVLRHVSPYIRWQMSVCSRWLGVLSIDISREYNAGVITTYENTPLSNFIGVYLKDTSTMKPRCERVAYAYETRTDPSCVHIHDYHLYRLVKPEIRFSWLLCRYGDIDIVTHIVEHFEKTKVIPGFDRCIAGLITRGECELAKRVLRVGLDLDDNTLVALGIHRAYLDLLPLLAARMCDDTTYNNIKTAMSAYIPTLNWSLTFTQVTHIISYLSGDETLLDKPFVGPRNCMIAAAICGRNDKLVKHVLDQGIVDFGIIMMHRQAISDTSISIIEGFFNANDILLSYSHRIPDSWIKCFLARADTTIVVPNVKPNAIIIHEHITRGARLTIENLRKITLFEELCVDDTFNLVTKLFIYEGATMDLYTVKMHRRPECYEV